MTTAIPPAALPGTTLLHMEQALRRRVPTEDRTGEKQDLG